MIEFNDEGSHLNCGSQILVYSNFSFIIFQNNAASNNVNSYQFQ